GLGLGDGGGGAGGGLPFGGLRGGHGLIGVAEAGGGGGVLAGELVAAEGVGLGLALEAVERTAVGGAALGADADLGLQPAEGLDVGVEGALVLGERLLAGDERRPLRLEGGLGLVHARGEALDLGAEP